MLARAPVRQMQISGACMCMHAGGLPPYVRAVADAIDSKV
jgi:hypothetical protein